MCSEDLSIRRADICIRTVIAHDDHTRTQILEVLASTDLSQPVEYLKLMESMVRKSCSSTGATLDDAGTVIQRHCDKKGKYLHFFYECNLSGEFKLTSSCTDACSIQQCVVLEYSDAFEVKFCRTPIQVPTSAKPILAGQCLDGREKHTTDV